VTSGVVISSVVAEPDVVTFCGKFEGWSLVFSLHDPLESWVAHSVLEKDNFRSIFGFWCSHSEHLELVTIFGRDFVLFKFETSCFNNLFEGHVELFWQLDLFSGKEFPEITILLQVLEILNVLHVESSFFVVVMFTNNRYHLETKLVFTVKHQRVGSLVNVSW